MMILMVTNYVSWHQAKTAPAQFYPLMDGACYSVATSDKLLSHYHVLQHARPSMFGAASSMIVGFATQEDATTFNNAPTVGSTPLGSSSLANVGTRIRQTKDIQVIPVGALCRTDHPMAYVPLVVHF